MSPKSEKPHHATGKVPARRARRISLILLGLVAATFIGMSTWQLAAQVFGYAPSTSPVSPACAGSLRSFLDAIDENRAREGLAGALASPVDARLAAVERECTTGKDYEGFVAAKRLRDAALSRGDDDTSNLARFRRAVDMRLSPQAP